MSMMQNLLIERFKLAYHYEKKEMPKYDLTVGKNGPKLRESPPEPPPEDGASPPLAAPGPSKKGPDGFLMIHPSRGSLSRQFVPAGVRITGSECTTDTTDQIVGVLSVQLGEPVVDATGLTGKYDFTLTFSGDVSAGATPENNLPDLFGAIQEQLGLKLVQKKGPDDIFVIDHVEENPTDN